ncbi:MAG: hypothetical protein ACYDHN_04875 [Solirubrobacteraceae bacterium]
MGSALVVAAICASSASALATTAPPSKFSSSPGLPDDRVYEEVSPPNKNGFSAGVKTQSGNTITYWSYASPDGNSLLYFGNGPFGDDSHFGLDNSFVAHRTVGSGWHTKSATPRPQTELTNSLLRLLQYTPTWIDISEDLSHTAFSPVAAWGPFPDENRSVLENSPQLSYGYSHLFMAGPDPAVPADWIAKPSSAPERKALTEPIPLGGNSDFSTFYFTSEAPVLPADAARAERVSVGASWSGPWGFYESHDGVVSEAGILPDGSLDPRGAAPAGSANISSHIPLVNRKDNEIAANGAKAYFVSPDPNDSQLGEPQLYVHETAAGGSEKTVLISQSQLPGHVGEKPAEGPALGRSAAGYVEGEPKQWFQATADGSHAFFSSRAQLTGDAPSTTLVNLANLHPFYSAPYTISVEIGGVKETTALLGESVTPAEIQAAIGGLPIVGVGHVSVTEERVTITGLPHATVTLNPGRFYLEEYGGPGTDTYTVEVNGVSQTTAPLSESASSAEVQAALEALSNVGAGNVTVELPLATFSSTVMDHNQVHMRSAGGGVYGPSATGTNEAPILTYDFDLATDTLTYLPSATGDELIATASDGSWLLLENRQTSPAQLELWKRGSGSATPVVQMPGGEIPRDMALPVQVAADNRAFVFETAANIAGFNNGGGGAKEVYRYDIAADELDCISCTPKGIPPTGGSLSYDQPETWDYEFNGESHAINENHDLSADGNRVLFDTRDALVPQDTNGTEDVYEWEDGNVFLISTGISAQPSHLLDGNFDGGDAFFATAQGLAPGDTDGGYDVYDARIPHPGDNPPASAVPCQGDVCQGPPSIASLLGAPASATFSGLGNPAPAVTPKPVTKKVTPKKKKRRKKKKKTGKAKSKTTHGKRAARTSSDSKAKG